jgi:hypothetical protein
MELTRRHFLAASAALAAPAAAQSGDWYDRPMRWAQVAFTEDDPGRFDPQFWFDYFRRIHAEGACLSAGGCVAFYPTEVPLHYRSRFLGSRDSFGEMVEGCRKLGMNVIARTDPHACREEAFEQHPDWVARLADGRPRRHWAAPELYVTCALGPYNFDFMTRVTREIVSRYKVDGMFSNRWSGHGLCHCEHCRNNFKAFRGLELPRTGDPRDPARRHYIVWRQQRLFELWRLWDSEIREDQPPRELHREFGRRRPLTARHEDDGQPGRDAVCRSPGAARPDGAVGERQERQGVPLHARATSRSAASSAWAWRSPIAGRTRCRPRPKSGSGWPDGIANGLRPWFTKFNAKPYRPALDARGGIDIYQWHWKQRALPAQHGVRWRAWRWCTRSRPRASMGGSRRGRGGGPGAR